MRLLILFLPFIIYAYNTSSFGPIQYTIKHKNNNISTVQAILYNHNYFIRLLQNQKGKLKDNSNGEADPDFSWTSPITRDMLEDLTPQEIESLDGDINNYESLRAAKERMLYRRTTVAKEHEALGNGVLDFFVSLIVNPLTQIILIILVVLSVKFKKNIKELFMKNLKKIINTIVPMFAFILYITMIVSYLHGLYLAAHESFGSFILTFIIFPWAIIKGFIGFF